jgi:hypothetical protein
MRFSPRNRRHPPHGRCQIPLLVYYHQQIHPAGVYWATAPRILQCTGTVLCLTKRQPPGVHE